MYVVVYIYTCVHIHTYIQLSAEDLPLPGDQREESRAGLGGYAEEASGRALRKIGLPGTPTVLRLMAQKLLKEPRRLFFCILLGSGKVSGLVIVNYFVSILD